jgi:hypothetical protein
MNDERGVSDELFSFWHYILKNSARYLWWGMPDKHPRTLHRKTARAGIMFKPGAALHNRENRYICQSKHHQIQCHEPSGLKGDGCDRGIL